MMVFRGDHPPLISDKDTWQPQVIEKWDSWTYVIHTVDGPAKSCTWMGLFQPRNNGINHLSTGAGFRHPFGGQQKTIPATSNMCSPENQRLAQK